jgi:hypothetical protein
VECEKVKTIEANMFVGTAVYSVTEFQLSFIWKKENYEGDLGSVWISFCFLKTDIERTKEEVGHLQDRIGGN